MFSVFRVSILAIVFLAMCGWTSPVHGQLFRRPRPGGYANGCNGGTPAPASYSYSNGYSYGNGYRTSPAPRGRVIYVAVGSQRTGWEGYSYPPPAPRVSEYRGYDDGYGDGYSYGARGGYSLPPPRVNYGYGARDGYSLPPPRVSESRY